MRTLATRPPARMAARLAAVIALAAGPTAAGADEGAARAILQGMTDYLEAQQSLSFDVDTTFEIVTTDDQKLAVASSGSVALQRPDKLRALRRGGFATVEVVFDGTSLSVLNRDANVYAQAALPGTVDQLIETLRTEHGRALPAADFMASDVGAVLMAEVAELRDLGSGVIRGQECDHLAFRTPEVDWQVWIAQGDQPHPCRFVITTKSVTGWPQYTLEFSAWGAGAAAADFGFAAPAGAQVAAALGDVPDLDDLAGIYAAPGGN